jgi:16S rRNA (cytosine967-C5)-methyltransferase
MDTRHAAVKCLIKILDENKTSDEVINNYAEKVNSPSELINLTVGTIKFKLKLDFYIEKLSSRPLNKISASVKNILRAAIYELEFLKTPEYAVINSYVELSKKFGKSSSGFVNAVLRGFLRGDISLSLPQNISINLSHPEWLVKKWIEVYGEEETIKICEFNNKPPKLSVRINTLKSSKQEVMNLFEETNVEFAESKICEDCLILKNSGNIKNIAGFKEGLWIPQGESSSLVAMTLAPQEDEKILDLCAAPGGKTTHIAALMNNTGEITAVDINENRIKRILENCERLGVTNVKTIASNAETFSSDEKFDRILIDAPCSNTGVFGKRPDARWKRTEQDIIALTEIQRNILNNAKKLLKNGSILVYSTCSIEPEENTLQIKKFMEENKNFELESELQLLQSKDDTDGFYIAKLIYRG